MAIIYTYPNIGTPEDTDIMLISDVSLDSNATRNITLSNLAQFINSKVELIITGDVGAGFVNLSTQALSVIGTANQIQTAATDQTIQIGLPNNVSITNNLTVGNVVQIDSLTSGFLPYNNQQGILADSIITQAASGQGVTVTGQLNVTEDFYVTGSTELFSTLTVEGVATFNDEVECTNHVTVQGIFAADGNSVFSGGVTINEQLIDGDGSTGTAGQVLSSTGSGVEWVDASSGGGDVGGSGTTNTLPIWSDGPNSVLGDSQIVQTKIDGGTVFDLNAVTTTTYTPAINTKLLDLNSGGNQKFSITQDGGGGVVLPSGDILNSGPSFNMGGNAFANGENALSVGASTTAFGNGSLAANFLTLASGGGASAFGLLTEASALASAAFGNKSIASGNYSVASGQDSIASGQSSVAIGEKGDARGKNTFVSGFGGKAIGNNAVKFGYDGSADGNNSAAFGFESIASGNNSFASGWQTVASGLYSFTAGDGNIASGERTAAFGVDNNVSGKGSFAIGARNIVPSLNCFVGGTDNTLVGSSAGVDGAIASFVFGYQNTVEGQYSAVLGSNNDTGESTSVNRSDRVTLIGHSNIVASGDSSTLIGLGNRNSSGADSYIVGKDNLNTLGGNSYIFGRVNDIDSCESSVIIGTVNEMIGNFSTPNITLVGVGLKFDTTGPNNGYGRATYVGYYNDDQDTFAQFQIGNGTDASRKNALSINKESEIKISQYGSGAVTGTATYNLAVAADGKIIETADTTPTYLSFVCLLTQSGAANPQPNIVLENSLGVATPFSAFTRVSAGEYNLNAPGKFKLLKTIVFINGGIDEHNHNIAWEVIDTDNLRIRTHNNDNRLEKASLEIRTYN